MAGSISKISTGKYRARYRDNTGKQHARHFDRRGDARTWLDEQTSALVTGRHVEPKTRKVTVANWCERWLEHYTTANRESTAAQAGVHVRRIVAGLGDMPLSEVKPDDVIAWMGQLRTEGLALSTRQALHRRLSAIYSAAMRNDLVGRSPVSRYSAPAGDATKAVRVCSEDQVWQLYDAMPEGMRPAVLLGAYAGLRVAEIAAVRPADVDFLHRRIRPAVQWPGNELKTTSSRWPVPLPAFLADELSAAVARWGQQTVVVGTFGRPVTPYRLEEAWRKARATVPGLPEGFRLHDLRHFYASWLIAAGHDTVAVSRAMRHASPAVTMRVYAHLLPGREDQLLASLDKAGEQRTRQRQGLAPVTPMRATGA